MFKYTFSAGFNISIKTPITKSMKEVDFTSEQTADCIKSTSKYPNGLIIKTEQYPDKIIMETNKRVVLLEDGLLGFED